MSSKTRRERQANVGIECMAESCCIGQKHAIRVLHVVFNWSLFTVDILNPFISIYYKRLRILFMCLADALLLKLPLTGKLKI